MPTTMDMRQIEQEVWATYTGYFECFQRRDVSGTAAHFVAPVFRRKDGVTQVYATDADVITMLNDLWAALAARGYGHAVAEAHQVRVFNATSVLLRVQGTRYDRSGLPYERFNVLYTFVRTDHDCGWRIAGFTTPKGDRGDGPTGPSRSARASP